MAYKRRSGSYLSAAIVIAALRLSVEPQAVHADFTTCASDQLSWYTDIAGESPCTTYQRLRRICNKDYQVDIFSSTAPGDRCEDKVSTLCCCNMIAFQLSMLCMVCQLDTENVGVGFDAHKGTFGVYRNGCTTSPVTNHTLPDNIQSIVCKEDIPLQSFLYHGWDDGTWFYGYTKTLAEQVAKKNNTVPQCQNAIALSSTPIATGVQTSRISSIATPSQSSDPNTSERSKSQSNLTLIVGIVGSLISLAIVVLAVVIWRRRNTKSQGLEGGTNIHEYSTVTPFSTSASEANAFTRNKLSTEGGPAPQILGGSGPIPGTTGSDSGSLPPPYDHAPVPGNVHSNAAWLPPVYDGFWDRYDGRRTHPSAGAAGLPLSGSANFKKLRGGRQ